MIVTPLIKGFALGGSLIMAIGAQNAFVLKQGLKRHHLFLTALTCFVCDAILIILGVTGIGKFIAELPTLSDAMRWGGALFLIIYGLRSFYQVFHPHNLVADLNQADKKSRLATFFALLGFTLLNPHTYIDTFLLLGTIGAEQPQHEHTHFIIGTLMASFLWFFGLTYGAGLLTPLFKNPRAWQILDGTMGVVMLSLGLQLVI